MAISTYSVKGKKLFEVYVNGFDIRGKRLQMRKRGIQSIKKPQNPKTPGSVYLLKLYIR